MLEPTSYRVLRRAGTEAPFTRRAPPLAGTRSLPAVLAHAPVLAQQPALHARG